MTTQEAINAILNGEKVKGIDWDENEYIHIVPFKGLLNESGSKLDAMVFIVNSNWEVSTAENQGE